MRYALATLMVLHGLGHLPGFLIPWGMIDPPTVATRTYILEGVLGTGTGVLLAFGLLWLLLGAAFAAAAYGLARETTWWRSATVYVSSASLLACVLYLPDTTVGLLVNVLLLTYLLLAERVAWIPSVVD